MAANSRAMVQGNAAQVQSLPAPLGGWNARDSLANMEPTDAITLINMFPTVSSLTLRGGYVKHATGMSGKIQTIMVYNAGATSKIFAITSLGSIFDVTAAGAVGAAVVTGLTNGIWEYINITTAGGSYLMAVNGVDSPLLYDGTTWTNPTITGVTGSTLSNITLFKNRIWFIEKNTLKAWYLPTGAIGGAASALDLSSIVFRGGYLMAVAPWTMDAGYGMDDMLAFITSEGEVAVYRGSDPSSATTWALVGVFWMGSPIGRRCAIKFAGDLLFITQDGVVSMASSLQSSRVNPKAALSYKIQYAISQAISLYGGNFGWQLVQFPRENMLILNVPIQEGQNQQQYVMSTIKRGNGDWAWCNFTGWQAACWEIWEDDIYFGGDGFVGKAWNGYDDNGTNIAANGLQAFNDFGSDQSQKRFTMMRPILQSDGNPSILGSMNVDFDTSDPTAPLAFTSTSYAVWDTALWDTGLWAGAITVIKNWNGCTGVGYWAAPRLKTASMGIQVAWVNTTVVFEHGGII